MLDNRGISKLIYEISTGDKNALERLWIEMKDSLYSFILSYIHDRHLAEDALQETFISLYRSAGGFRRNTNARAWIYTIARNTTISLLRRQKETVYEVEKLDQFTGENDIEKRTGQRDELDRLLQSLDATSRIIVLLHAVNDLKHREIAKVLSLPLGTVYRKYSQSIKKLQKLYSMQIIEEV